MSSVSWENWTINPCLSVYMYIFLRWRQLKWGAPWHTWSCDTFGTSIGIMYNASSIVNATTAFLRSRWQKQNLLVIWHPWHWCHVIPLALVSASCDINGIINGSIVCLDKTTEIRAKWSFWSCNATSTCNCILWCKCCHQCHDYIPPVKVIKIRCNMTYLVMWCHWHQQCMTPMTLSMTLIPKLVIALPSKVL